MTRLSNLINLNKRMDGDINGWHIQISQDNDSSTYSLVQYLISDTNQFRINLGRTMLWILLTISLIHLSAGKSLYFSIPYQTVRQEQSVWHLIDVEINRFSYQIDLTLQNQQDEILSLEQVSQNKIMNNRPDYRKNEKSVFGIVAFSGKQILDERVEFKRRLIYNIYYYFRDFSTKITWINLNNIKQVQYQYDESTVNKEGAFNFGPKNQESQILKDFKKYSKFMQRTIITFKGNKKNENGEVIFGQFPTNQILSEKAQTTALQYLNQQSWLINTIGLQLSNKNGKNIAKTNLYKQLVKVKLTISSRTLIIPNTSAQALQKSIPRCTYTVLPNSEDTKTYLSCNNLTTDQLQYLSLDFAIKDSQTPISFLLKNLVILNQQNIHWFDIRAGDTNEYQLSESILRQYMIGIDYKQGKFMYGLLAGQSWLTKALFFKIFAIGNIVIFAISLLIVLMEKKVRQRMKIAIKQEFGLPDRDMPSATNSYSLASASEENLAQ